MENSRFNSLSREPRATQKDNNAVHLDVEADVGDPARAVVEVHRELVERQLLLQELAQVALQKVPAGPFLEALGPRESAQPRHVSPATDFPGRAALGRSPRLLRSSSSRATISGIS